MKTTHVLGAAVAASLALGAFAAQAGGEKTVRGPATPFGPGEVRAWATLDGQGRPQAVGVSFSEAAVAELGHDMIFATVPLPEAAREAGFDHLSLDWMPHGHPPMELFGSGHFDVHFYRVSEVERLAVDPADPLYLEKAAREPARELMPADYMPPPVLEPIPAMGVHWIDVTDPVMNGAPFENILIYGAWDGEVTFVEPMITRDLLASRRTVVETIKEPAAVAEPGWWPTRYRIAFDRTAGVHEVVLEGLVWREPGERRPAKTALAN